MPFQEAVKEASYLKMTIDGPSGSGKTYTMMRWLTKLNELRGGEPGKIAVIDTERGSSQKYVGKSPDGIPFKFQVLQPTTFSPQVYINAIWEAVNAGFKVLGIDSLSHAWSGMGGALDLKDRATQQTGGNSYTAWGMVTPLHKRMIDTILQTPIDIICTMRAYQEYVMRKDAQGNVVDIERVGLRPDQRAMTEYEFDVIAMMNMQHIMTVDKSRFESVADLVVEKPGADFVMRVWDELKGAPPRPMVYEPITPEIDVNEVLAALMTKHDPAAIMQANNGKIPGNVAEVLAVQAALEGGN